MFFDDRCYNKYQNIDGRFDKNHLLKHGVKKKHIIKEKVNSINIKELLNKYNIKNLDLLYIDAEGYDGKIVIDFLMNTNLKPIIIFEYIHINNETFNTLLFNHLLNILLKAKLYHFLFGQLFIFFLQKPVKIIFDTHDFLIFIFLIYDLIRIVHLFDIIKHVIFISLCLFLH